MSRTRGASRARRRSSSTDTAGSAHEGLERHDPIAERAAGSLVRDLVADRGADERGSERGAGGHGARVGRLLLGVLGDQIRLVVLVVEVERRHRDQHAGPDRVGRRRRLDDVGVAEHLLNVPDACLHQTLLVLGGVVLRVLAQIAVLARDLDLLGDLGAPRTGEVVELGLQPVVRVQRERRRRLLAGRTGRTRLELLGKVGHGPSLAAGPPPAPPPPGGPDAPPLPTHTVTPPGFDPAPRHFPVLLLYLRLPPRPLETLRPPRP